MIAALLFAANAAVATPPATCPQMNVFNVAIFYQATNASCNAFGDVPCRPGLPIQFMPVSYAYNFACSVHTFHWEFGDGTFSNEPYPFHTYVAHGTYPITLTIADYEQIITLVSSVTVFGSLFDLSATPNATVVQFRITAHGPVARWLFDFGDGTTMVLEGANPPEITHTYAKAGTYNVVVVADSLYIVARQLVITIPRSRAVRH